MNISNFFNDLKIIELASVLAGPSVGMFFAELGATVLKIENKTTNGDVTRQWKLPAENPDTATSAYYHSINWGKEILLLDLREPSDYQIMTNHLKSADLVITNFKKSSAQKLKLDYHHLQKIQPKLIYANINAYGPNDPRPGFDAVIQAETGWLSMNGTSDGQAAKLPVALMDILTAHQLKEGVLLALLHRARTGEGCEVQASLFDTGVASLANQASNWLNANHLPTRMGTRHPNIAPYGDILLSKDRVEVLLSVGTEAQYLRLLEMLELESLKEDTRFLTNALRLQHRDSLVEQLRMAAAQLTSAEILKRSAKYQVPLAPIRNLEQLFSLPATKSLLLEGATNTKKYQVVKTVAFTLTSSQDESL